MDDAEHRRDDAERRQAVGRGLEGLRRLVAIVREGLDFLVHQRLDLMGARVSDDDQATIVADESHQILVGHQLRKGLEDLGLARVVEMALDFAARFRSQFAHQRVQHAHHVEVVARLGSLVEDRFDERLAAIFDGRHRVGDDEDAQRRPADDDELEGLRQHFEMTAERRIAAENGADRDEKADGEIQGALLVFEPPMFAT